ncbi:uncharacterized protein [Notamacropus eugenii]|uniref:uncharacterized protein n=1 Tax=Notamacropus eugenii TaxID=9315 RepID=UPI003B6809DE
MRKIFKILRRRERSPSGSSSPRRDSEVRPLVPGAGYVIRMKDLGKIHKAASFGDVARVQHLLLLGQAHVDDLDKEKRTPLHLASANGHPDVVSLLVERKCKINLRDKHYQTSLMKAVQCQQEECARILLDYGADPALMDTHDNTALHYAASGLNTAIAAKLLRHTIDMEAKNKVEVYLLCEKIFSEIKCVNQEGCTPLLLAVKENNRDMVDLFLKNGANVNTSDRLDRTALMIAARCKPTGVVSLLLQYDIDLSCRDAFGQTAEEHAAFSGHSIHYELIYQYGQQKAINQPLSLQISSLERAADSRFTVTVPANDQEELIIDSNCCDANAITGSTPNYGFHSLIHILGSNKPIRFVGSCDDSLERHQNVKSIQPTTEKHVYYTNDNLGNGVQEKRKSYLVEERNLDDSDDIDGSSEESQESFDKSDLEQDTVQMDANNCDDLTQSSVTATEGDDLPALNYTNVLLVMEQLSVGCDGTNDEEELKETQGPLFPGLNVIALQSGILNNPLSKQKENKTTASKITQTSEIFTLIPDSHEKEKYLFDKNQILEDENAMLKLEVDTLKIKNRDKEKHIEILKEKNDYLQQKLQLNAEILTAIRVQYSEEVNVVTAENAVLNSKLDTAKQNTERLEGEIESYRSRLMSVIDDYEQSEASKLALEHSFQEARDEWLHVQDKLYSDLSSLRENHAFLSEELSQAESGAKSLENELGHVHESLREKTYIVENTQRELNHAEEKAKELEETNRVLKEKLNRCSLENESLQERLGQIQSENMVLQQALEDTQKKVTMKEKQLRDAQVQFIDLFKKLYADSEKQVLLVEESKKVLVSECNHFGEEMCKYEIEKAERGLGH